MATSCAKRKNIFSKAERLRRLDEALDTAISEAVMLDFNAEEIVDRLSKRLDKLLPQH